MKAAPEGAAFPSNVNVRRVELVGFERDRGFPAGRAKRTFLKGADGSGYVEKATRHSMPE